MGKGIRERDWGKRCMEGTVGKRIQGWDWTVGKGISKVVPQRALSLNETSY